MTNTPTSSGVSAEAHEWDENEFGLWCPACGNIIAAPWNMEAVGFKQPLTCDQCGFPDFEDGMDYFTGDD